MTVNRKTIPTLIEKREAFSNSGGTVRAMVNPYAGLVSDIADGFTDSQLNESESSRLRIDNDTVGIAYLIMSYNTPIAWETRQGHVYKVQQTFTQTTSKHQGLLYRFHEKEQS